jgi:hypothetical protein
MKKMKLKIGCAWAIKQNIRDLWSHTLRGRVSCDFASITFGPCLRILRGPLEKLGCSGNTNADAFSGVLELRAQAIKKVAYGFGGRESLKAEIYFQCGRVQRYPVTYFKNPDEPTWDSFTSKFNL